MSSIQLEHLLNFKRELEQDLYSWSDTWLKALEAYVVEIQYLLVSKLKKKKHPLKRPSKAMLLSSIGLQL